MSKMKALFNGCIAEGYSPTADGVLMSPERMHTNTSPVLAQDELPTGQGRGWINHLERSKKMTPQVLVYGFAGQRLYGKPGMIFRPMKVREDFGEWRDTKSDDGKAVQKWLLRQGYRKVWYRAEGAGESAKYLEYWAHTSLVGESAEHLHIPPSILKKLVVEQPAKEISLEEFASQMCG
jgi:hypothetical protein